MAVLSPPTPRHLGHTVTVLPTWSPLSTCECFLRLTSNQPRDLVASSFLGAPSAHLLLLPSPAHVLGPDGGLLQGSLPASAPLGSTHVLWEAGVDPFPALGPPGGHGDTGNVPSDLGPRPSLLARPPVSSFKFQAPVAPHTDNQSGKMVGPLPAPGEARTLRWARRFTQPPKQPSALHCWPEATEDLGGAGESEGGDARLWGCVLVSVWVRVQPLPRGGRAQTQALSQV